MPRDGRRDLVRNDGEDAMNARVFVMVLSVLCVAAGWWKAIAWAGPTTSACELLTIQEVSKALNASVILDQSASGPDGRDGDNCV